MKYSCVALRGLAYTLPDEIVTSTELEARLEPLYRRLRLPEGRLELMTGIRERRFWPPGTLPGDHSIVTVRKLLETSEIDPAEVGMLVHASVCRDYIEPATACRVHHAAGLLPECLVYDVSNACLGILNGMIQVANAIELGQVRAGIVVGTEDSRPIVENTIHLLNTDESLTREQMKLAVATLTLGSGSVAVLLTHRDLNRAGRGTAGRILAAHGRAHTVGNALCRGTYQSVPAADGSVASVAPVMQTDSEQLLVEGIAAAQPTFRDFLSEAGWSRTAIARTICHQVGSAHRKLMLSTLELDPARDFTTYETLGNTGSVALPITLAKAGESGALLCGDRVALMGIGSGINVLMMAVEWQGVPDPDR
jgi:3-oxoacyl-[acyl-carrier-protein] synthase-3